MPMNASVLKCIDLARSGPFLLLRRKIALIRQLLRILQFALRGVMRFSDAR